MVSNDGPSLPASRNTPRPNVSLSPSQRAIFLAFGRFAERHRRLPSSAEAQAGLQLRDSDVPSYASVMTAFPGRTWAEVRAWAAGELGLDVEQVSRRASAKARTITTTSSRSSPATDGPLSDAQFELLWEISREARLADHLDGRTLRALVARGLARREGDWLRGTGAAHSALRAHLQALARAARGRSAAIYRALLELEASVVPGSEVCLGSAIVPADDVVLGIFRHARALDV